MWLCACRANDKSYRQHPTSRRSSRRHHTRRRIVGAAQRLLTLRDVTGMTTLSRSAVYALMAESRFPKPIRIGSQAIRWVEGQQRAPRRTMAPTAKANYTRTFSTALPTEIPEGPHDP